MYGCTDVQVPPPFIHFIPLLWGVLACVAILPSAGYYWNHLEPCGTYTTLEPPGTIWNLYDPRILLDVPYLQYLKCMAALVCRSPPLSYILFPCSGLCWNGSALPPEPMRYHFHPFSLLLETIGTTWNLYDPRILLDVPCPPVPEMYGCTDVQAPPFHT